MTNLNDALETEESEEELGAKEDDASKRQDQDDQHDETREDGGSEQGSDGEQQGTGEREETQHVPLAALREERTRRQSLEQELANERSRQTKIDERLQQLNDRLTKSEEPEAPDPQEDPVGYLRHNHEQMRSDMNKLVERVDSFMSTSQENQIFSHAAALEQQFMAGQPHYIDAVGHLFQMVEANLIATGQTPGEAQVNRQNYAREIMRNAVQAGRNPGEVVWELALKSGYSPPAGNGKAGDGGSAGAAPIEDPIETIKRGVEQNQSLSKTGGKNKRELTADNIGEMTDDEFDKITDDQWRDMLRGKG